MGGIRAGASDIELHPLALNGQIMPPVDGSGCFS